MAEVFAVYNRWAYVNIALSSKMCLLEMMVGYMEAQSIKTRHRMELITKLHRYMRNLVYSVVGASHLVLILILQ